jgi:hypothetical protein
VGSLKYLRDVFRVGQRRLIAIVGSQRQLKVIEKTALNIQRGLLKRQWPEGAVALHSFGEWQALQRQGVWFTPAPLLLQEIHAGAFQGLLRVGRAVIPAMLTPVTAQGGRTGLPQALLQYQVRRRYPLPR